MEYLLEHIRKIESTKDIQELKRKLRRKKDMNSTEASLQIAQLFYDLLKDQTIKNKYKNNPSALILLVTKLGKTFTDIDPVKGRQVRLCHPGRRGDRYV